MEFEQELTKYMFKVGKYKQYCSRRCANSRIWGDEDKLKKSISAKNSEKVRIANSFNRGKLFNRIERGRSGKGKIKNCLLCGIEFYVHNSELSQKFCSLKCFHNSSIIGGYRKGSGHGRSGYYKGFWCDSTYELSYLIYCLDHNIGIIRNKEEFKYEFDGKIHKYIPDFIVDDTLIEIKGYYSKLVNIKKESVSGKKYKILYKDDLKECFDYIKKKYKVKNIIELYDNYKPKYLYKCNYCNKKFYSNIKKKTKIVFCSRSCRGKSIGYTYYGNNKRGINQYTKHKILI